LELFEPGWGYRLPLYIILGVVCEFLFTAIVDLINPRFLKSWNAFQKESSDEVPSWRIQGRDIRMQGYSFLWMLPIYALMILIEPLKEVFSEVSFLLRGVIYVVGVWVLEYIAGFIIKKISGRCPWDYSEAKYNLHGYIRFDFFPFWFALMMFIEWMSGKFILLTPAIATIFSL